jgi:hypothetical protein
MQYKHIFILILTCLVNSAVLHSQVDNYAKNSKLKDDEEKRFQQDLLNDKDSAEVYWRHANVVAAFTFKAQGTAWKYFEKAISIDSTRAKYFEDYGRYLVEVLHATSEANNLYRRGSHLFPENEILKTGFADTSNELINIKENIAFSSFGSPDISSHPKAKKYKEVCKFDDLIALALDKTSPYYYPTLLARFENDNALSDHELYMLLLGFTQEKSFNPYTAICDEVIDLNENGQFDLAIEKAKEHLKTNPLLPGLHKQLMFSYRKKGNFAEADRCQKKVQQILDAMLYTGDGSCKAPYIVFWVQAENLLIPYLGYKKTGVMINGFCADQISESVETTHKTTNEKTEIHFNITPIMTKVSGK